MAFDMTTFDALIRLDNPKFKRITKTSHLDPIINELKGKTFISPMMKVKLDRLVAFLPADRQRTYARALAYLTKEGGVVVGAIPTKPVMRFTQFAYQIGAYTGRNAAGQTKPVMLDPGTPGSPGPRGFVHRHVITWESSNGDISSLSKVRTREYVKFLADTQAEPFNAIQDPDREFYAPGNFGTVGANSGTDDHSTKLPALICCNPRKPGTLKAEQWYQYSIDGGKTWPPIEGAAYLIEKTVKKDGNDWVFIFKKTNWPLHNPKPFHFEVHYTVGPAPEYLPAKDTDVVNGGDYKDDIKKWARKVVSTG